MERPRGSRHHCQRGQYVRDIDVHCDVGVDAVTSGTGGNVWAAAEKMVTGALL